MSTDPDELKARLKKRNARASHGLSRGSAGARRAARRDVSNCTLIFLF